MEKGKKRITLAGTAQTELEEKHSRFIGFAAPVQSEKEAQEIIAGRRAQHRDATHNVWAYYIDQGVHARYSDDGEPQGTAGIPVLNVLKMSGATDLCVVVTRYFGGTLRGDWSALILPLQSRRWTLRALQRWRPFPFCRFTAGTANIRSFRCSWLLSELYRTVRYLAAMWRS